MPIGLIGPNLLIGALIGSAMGGIGAEFFPELSSHRSFYALLGMGAMMGAVLNAPLAALMALLELSNSTALIFPGMLAITVATLTNSEIFKQRSAQQTTLQYLKELLLNDPVSLALQRTSVASLMERDFATSRARLSKEQATQLMTGKQPWVVIKDDDNQQWLVSGSKLNDAISTALQEDNNHELLLTELCPVIPLSGLHIQATLREALTRMDERQVDALLISGYIASPNPEAGIITRRDIVTYYTTPQKY
jgi:CIC family chloride channel protein